MLIQFANVGFFPDQEFGLKRVSLELEWGKRYKITLANQDQMSGFLGILEGRYQVHRGRIYKARDYACHSDRLLLGDRVYKKKVGPFLTLESQPFLQFGGRRRAKRTLMEELRAYSLRHLQVYKLKGDERLKFALLSLGFQESGLILISQLFLRQLDGPMENFFTQLVQESRCALALVCHLQTPQEGLERWTGLANFLPLDLSQSEHGPTEVTDQTGQPQAEPSPPAPEDLERLPEKKGEPNPVD
ncbi:MAG: hypothetical protein A2600_04810 [Candidatus Lambdaproteobacteria bacterium RIFOXYD1_FULL_56_27]|uniref:ABC transporter domain-containing protein n=1 Tax=Candidatus Lambdaproteobacteria bacterium RIFOXYD2_FULL_56_26 TaxID=1817773 RepID=A0A1F6H407_9PROT|nr:MAG: hypothetical protein A2426_13875 [Candidatus Lambdaproteobacteria bacterium RIFOXYC1_FULL_56_13]OGH05074.1 MAG: hypothetical protein A2557_08875 [Candidatus Lambdaproteobacteria bacterium RIFOXYD2_FULL_56_26]OGH09539.1 MAG: hypothetical protein A2600_04810 [Candidatus Lambdaproteobacteria bacterium RIFOXYD1_FULL_56_27]